MLIVEHRHGAPAIPKHFENLLEELIARILRLAHFVTSVIAVFAHNDDAIDSQFVSAQCECFGDGGTHSHSRIAAAAFPA